MNNTNRSPKQDLKLWCKKSNWKFRWRKQGNYYYVTVGNTNNDCNDSFRWTSSYMAAVTAFFTNAVMTSGSRNSATFRVGSIFDFIRDGGV